MNRTKLIREVAARLFFVGLIIGCEKAPRPAADLPKTPWFDPTVQMEGLKHSDMRIRGVSAINLGNLGAAAAEAIYHLEKLAKDDPEPRVRQNALMARTKIGAATCQ